jgi:hypothetical protein
MKRAFLALILSCLAVPAAAQPTGADNHEMAVIVAADQAIRSGGPVDPQVMMLADAERRHRTRELFDSGALSTANDFYAAAFVFQHGSVPEDYLLAHVFAVRSLALGRHDAEWIAAASLDRYLQNVGTSQVYGTQYSFKGEPGKATTTMEPYDRALLTDALRVAAGTHTLAEQDARLPEMDALMKSRAVPAPKP